VLIYYRIANPVTYLLRARGHGEALTHLAYRELVHVLAARESFRVMIGEREEIAEKLRSTLQAAAERLGFGVEILFIGLRDIHPPVDVAPAYQDVVSAEEERHAIVYGGHKYRALNVPAAEATSNKKRLEAQSNGQARITKATGDANRFREIVSAFHAAPEFLRERLRLETLEEILPGRPKVVIDGDTPPPAPALFYLPLDPGYSVMPLLDEAPATME
jgi:membrane protease subunit HflK